jgi:hypothetical protein
MSTTFHSHSSYHFVSYTDTCDPIIMYCLGLFVGCTMYNICEYSAHPVMRMHVLNSHLLIVQV